MEQFGNRTQRSQHFDVVDRGEMVGCKPVNPITHQDHRESQPLVSVYDTPLYYWRGNAGVLFLH
jgi:hypothetical protein